MTEQLEYRISVYSVLFYLASLTAVFLLPTRFAIPAAAFILSPVITVLSAPDFLAAVIGSVSFWNAALLLLIPHAFIAYVINQDASANGKTEFWPLTVSLFGLPAVFLYGHLRMRG